MKLILGSSSPFRRRVLENAGIAFEIVTPDINEKKVRVVSHALTPVILSYAKAQAVAAQVSEPAIIIACDQVILCDNFLLEKPESPDDVRRWCKMYSRYPVNYINGFTVMNTETGESVTAQEIATVDFREMPPEFVEGQIEEHVVFKCAGGISTAMEDAYATVVRGSRESLAGLPVRFVMNLVRKVEG